MDWKESDLAELRRLSGRVGDQPEYGESTYRHEVFCVVIDILVNSMSVATAYDNWLAIRDNHSILPRKHTEKEDHVAESQRIYRLYKLGGAVKDVRSAILEISGMLVDLKKRADALSSVAEGVLL